MFFLDASRFAKKRIIRIRAFILAFYWIFGFFMGICLSSSTSEYNLSLMPILLAGDVSIVGMLIVFTFPFIVAAVLTYFSLRHFLYFFAFLKSFCFSFASSYVFLFFGNAGWLIYVLIMFSDLTSSVLFFWFLQCCITKGGNLYLQDAAFCFIVTAAIICVDHYLVTPFWLSLV